MRALKFYEYKNNVKVPLPTYPLYIQERGYYEEFEPPPNPFFKNCGALLGSQSTAWILDPIKDRDLYEVEAYVGGSAYSKPRRDTTIFSSGS